MSKLERFLTVNGRLNCEYVLAFVALAVALSLLGVPYVDGAMNVLAAMLLVSGAISLYVDRKIKS